MWVLCVHVWGGGGFMRNEVPEAEHLLAACVYQDYYTLGDKHCQNRYKKAAKIIAGIDFITPGSQHAGIALNHVFDSSP